LDIDWRGGVVINNLKVKPQKYEHVFRRTILADLKSVKEVLLIKYFSELIKELLTVQETQVEENAFESSWNIEKGIYCRYKNNKETFYLQIDRFQKGWRKKLFQRIHEHLSQEKGEFLPDSSIEIVELKVMGNIEEYCFLKRGVLGCGRTDESSLYDHAGRNKQGSIYS
jgi:hypothetical protein